MTITTSSEDDFLYKRLLQLLEEIKLVQGGTALTSTIRRHNQIKIYLIAKQIARIKAIEEKYFLKDGLNSLAIEEYNNRPLQNS